MTKFENKGTGKNPSRDCLYINQTKVINAGFWSNSVNYFFFIILFTSSNQHRQVRIAGSSATLLFGCGVWAEHKLTVTSATTKFNTFLFSPTRPASDS